MSENGAGIPLVFRCGMEILNPLAGAPGTLGFVAADELGMNWIVSCYHVLIRSLKPSGQLFASNEPVFHQHAVFGNIKIAETDRNHVSFDMDCAAARVMPGTVSTNELIGLGIVDEPCDPAVGMHVVKVARNMGIARGKVTDLLTRGRIRIEPNDEGIPANSLSEPGDSGALWVEEGSLRAVALHQKGNTQGKEFAIARNVKEVLSELRLKLWVPGSLGVITPIVS